MRNALLIRTYETEQIRASIGPQYSLESYVRISNYSRMEMGKQMVWALTLPQVGLVATIVIYL
jgi:hypothetical protein